MWFSVRDPEVPEANRDDRPEGAIHPDEPQSCSSVDPGTAAPVSEADAEDEVAAADARVAAARARLARLRRAAEVRDDDEAAPQTAVTEAAEQHPAKSIRAWLRWPRRSRRPRKLQRPGRKTVAVGAGILLVATSLGASGYMLHQHQVIAHKRQLSQEYAAAARQAVITLMSIDANHAKDDIQRIIDSSTSPLKDQLSVMSSLMLQQAEEAKTITKVNVEAVAVESPKENSAVALVMAKTDVTEANNKNRPPQLWRLSVEIVREDGQFKMSKVEFLQ